ncbi:MAG: hypothetical protein JXR76_13945 [Deltaproteobacteria bacterium]|nr:hypothetical protein [Deltaproteobacteria bacterium]
MEATAKSLMGGPSAYCISTGQLKSAYHLANEDPHSSPRIQGEIERLEDALTRNERAALAFVLIERLRDSHQ